MMMDQLIGKVRLFATAVLIALGMATFGGNTAQAQVPPCPTDSVSTAEDYVMLVDCILQVIYSDDWAELSAGDQAALAEYSSVFQSARQALTAVMLNDVIPGLDPGDKADFEFVVQNSYILEELTGLQNILAAKELSADKKKEAKKQAEDSVKGLLKKLAEKAPWGLGALVNGLIDVINEVLAVIRG
jgi:hypothetical protein